MTEEFDHVPLDPVINSEGHYTSDEPILKPNAVKKRTDVVPRYLRASTGSCHDACKCGGHHEFKDTDKPWRSKRRTSAPLSDGKKTVDVQIFVDRNVKGAVQTGKLGFSSAKKPSPTERAKKSLTSSTKSPLHDSSKLFEQEPGSFRKSPSPEVPKVMKKVIRSTGKSSLPDPMKSIKQEVAPAAKKDTSTEKGFSNAVGRNASVGPLKPNGATVKQSTVKSFTQSGAMLMSKAKTVDKAKATKVAVKKFPTPPIVAPSLKRNPKEQLTPISDVKTVSSHMRKIKNMRNKSQISQPSSERKITLKKVEPEEPVDANMEEKTLQMIETREDSPAAQTGSQLIHSPSPLSPESFNSSSQTNSRSFTSFEMENQDELDSEYTGSETDDSVSNFQGSGDVNGVDSLNLKRGQANGGTIVSDVQDPESMKLGFRRGKVVEPQSETNSGRKLRFKHGRILDNNQGVNGEPRRRSYRRRATNNDKKESETAPVKVVLKHQDVVTKKDAQVLLNNVIEQTANKLVETRKSKVKALVGAFETVISLQDRKPSTAEK